MEKLYTRANACGRGCSGKEHGRVPLRDISCICAPVNTNLPLITESFCSYVLFAGFTLTKRPGDVTKGWRHLWRVPSSVGQGSFSLRVFWRLICRYIGLYAPPHKFRYICKTILIGWWTSSIPRTGCVSGVHMYRNFLYQAAQCISRTTPKSSKEDSGVNI